MKGLEMRPKGPRTTQGLIKTYNKVLPLVDYLLPFTKDLQEVKIADIGCGPVSVIGSLVPGKKVQVYYSDSQDFTPFWEKRNLQPIISVKYQNMEKLTYEDNFFDIVCCINALDHTGDAEQAVKEMIRVCKKGGYVYIDCHLDQLNTGHKHMWNAKEDGTFTNFKQTFDLKEMGFQIRFLDYEGEARYNQILATLRK